MAVSPHDPILRHDQGLDVVMYNRYVQWPGLDERRVRRPYLHRDREVVCAVVYMMLYMYVVRSEWGADVGRVQGKM